MAMIEVDGLVRRYGELEAVKGISFQVAEGESFGFLGPNGAGKTTTINMLATLLRPTSGRAIVNGFDVVRQRNDVRRSIGLVFQQSTLDEALSAEQNLRFHAYALITALVAGISVVTDREAGFLREILVAPLNRAGVVIGKTVGAAAVVLVQAGMLLVIAPLVGVPIDIPTVLRLLAVLIVLAFGLSGLGMLIAAFMRSQQSYQTIVQVLVFPLIFLAGVFFPVDSLPLWLQVPSKLNPVTYGVDAIRQIMLASFPSHTALGISVLGHTMMLVEEIVIVGVLGLIFASAATWAFGRQE
jgi:ABC-2 type transport system permease protein